MVYVDPKNLGYDPYWTKWVNARLNKQEQTLLQKLYEKYVTPLIDMVLEGIVDGREEKKLKTIVPLTNLNMVSLDMLLVSCNRFYLFNISLSITEESTIFRYHL